MKSLGFLPLNMERLTKLRSGYFATALSAFHKCCLITFFGLNTAVVKYMFSSEVLIAYLVLCNTAKEENREKFFILVLA